MESGVVILDMWLKRHCEKVTFEHRLERVAKLPLWIIGVVNFKERIPRTHMHSDLPVSLQLFGWLSSAVVRDLSSYVHTRRQKST